MIDFKNGSVIKLARDDKPRLGDAEALLIPGETVISTYSAFRDYVVFTDKRIISVNVQGVSGKKQAFTSLPYSKVSVFAVETAGHLDLDSELELYFTGLGKVTFDFSGKSDIVKIGQAISAFVLA